MYPELAQKVKEGKLLLEWDNSKGTPPAPLLKDVHGTERRIAKVLNFSIAYGKTSRGLAKDWNVSVKEATEILNKWYADRPEVKEWQERTIETAIQTGYTRTLLGRYRKLDGIQSKKRSIRNHAMRAAINTPLQGGAADVVNRAMVKLSRNDRLVHLGWKQILQIHDEIILEGPEESTQEALHLVTKIMENPLDEPLLIKLEIACNSGKSWYDAK